MHLSLAPNINGYNYKVVSGRLAHSQKHVLRRSHTQEVSQEKRLNYEFHMNSSLLCSQFQTWQNEDCLRGRFRYR